MDKTPSVELAYREAVHYLDSHDGEQDGLATPEQAMLLRYYSDIGRFDPYERYQDRIRKKLGDTARLVVRHLWEFWRAAFYWSFSTSRIVGLRIPNLLFVMLGTLALGYATIWYSSWTSRESSSLPRSVRAIVDFSHGAKVTVEAKLPGTDLAHRPAASSPPTLGQIFNLTCPLDDGNISLLPVITEMIRKRSKHSSGTITCPGGEEGTSRIVLVER